MEKYDVVIIGGGNARMGVTVATHAAGLSVATIEASRNGSRPKWYSFPTFSSDIGNMM